MTWTYSPSLTTNKDKVRRLIGDVLTVDQLVSDEEIAGIFTIEPNIFRAASLLCDSLASQFSREADKAIDDMSKTLSQRAKAFADRAARLEDRANSSAEAGSMPRPFFGGQSVSGKGVQRSNTDRVQPLFERDSMEFPPPHANVVPK